MASEFEVPGKRPARRPVNLSRATLALVSAAALVPVVAWAQSASQDINLTASVTPFCTFTSAAPVISNATNITVVSAASPTSAVQITTPTTATGLAQGASFLYEIGALCNAASTATITSLGGGLKDSTPEPIASGTFKNRLDYTATVQWGLSSQFTTNGTANASATSSQSGPRNGPVAVSVAFAPDNSAPVVAGDYADTLRITLAPQ